MPGLTGGGGGIRTHETLLGPNGFQDRRFQPLTHPSRADYRLLADCDLDKVWHAEDRNGDMPEALDYGRNFARKSLGSFMVDS